MKKEWNPIENIIGLIMIAVSFFVLGVGFAALWLRIGVNFNF
jgi:hypothetical protein